MMAMTTLTDSPNQGTAELHLRLKIWHHDCWSLQTTKGTNAGLVSNGVYVVDTNVKANVIAYGPTRTDVNQLIDRIQSSPLADDVSLIHEKYSFRPDIETAGNATQEMLVTYEPQNSIHDTLISHEFIPNQPIRIRDGYEYWTVVTDIERSHLEGKLEELRKEMDATIEIQTIGGSGTKSSGDARTNSLTERQREVFELAQHLGYYSWPRECSPKEIGWKLDLVPATVLEHLRKAESKLLGK